MRQLKTILAIAMAIISSICTPSYAQSPYAIFGDNSRTLDAKRDTVPNLYRIEISNNDGAAYYAEFDFVRGTATVYDLDGNIVNQDTIRGNAKARFMTVDPEAEKYPHLSPYNYCGNDPVNCIDPDGQKVVFVNGYLGFGSPNGGAAYWNGANSLFVKRAKETFNDFATPYFTNYNYSFWEGSTTERESLGYNYAKNNYKALTEGMELNVDKFNFVSHSMGGAFSEGMIKYLAEQGWETENAVFLNAWDPTQINSKKESTRIDATCTNDPVQSLSFSFLESPDIPSSDKIIRIKSKESIEQIHRALIDKNSYFLWKQIDKFLSE